MTNRIKSNYLSRLKFLINYIHYTNIMESLSCYFLCLNYINDHYLAYYQLTTFYLFILITIDVNFCYRKDNARKYHFLFPSLKIPYRFSRCLSPLVERKRSVWEWTRMRTHLKNKDTRSYETWTITFIRHKSVVRVPF